jgi:PAS domain S-box-containing protein
MRDPPITLVTYDLAFGEPTPGMSIAELRRTLGDAVVILLVRAEDDHSDSSALSDAPIDELLPRPTFVPEYERQARRRLLLAARAAEASALREEIAARRSIPGIPESGRSSSNPAAEQERRRSEQRFRALFDQAPLGVLHFDRELRVVACNPQLARALGYASLEEMIGLDLTKIRDQRILPAFQRALLGAPAHYEGPYRPMRRGSRRWVAIHLSPLRAEDSEVEGGIAVIQDITAQREAVLRLAAQAKELERVNRALQQRSGEVEEALLARNRLYTAMNHELRTPISAIMLYHDLLLDGSMGRLNTAQKEGLENAQRAAQHLLELVQEVLELSRLESGNIAVAPQRISVTELVHEAVETVRPLADRRGSIFEMRGLEPGLTVTTDARRLRQIMLNLLSNAVKFGGGRPITVASCRLPDGSVALDVADRGRGIAPEDLERIFDEFVQVGNHQEGGSGLGLSISRRLTELLGGTLTAESRPGSGSTFRLLLPPTPPPPRSAKRRAEPAESR